jgi:hypothetical protein
MKALSIKQPWCSLIAMGAKPVENRSRNTNYRGRIYLHASGQPMKGSPRDIIGHNRWDTLIDNQKEATWEAMKLNGAIIGEATIIDCVLDHKSIWADHKTLVSRKVNGELQFVEVPCYQWVLSDVVMYDEPILGVKGMLGLWNYERPFEVVGSAELATI